MMWRYIKRYLPYVILAGLFMVGEVLIDLIQPELMSQIVDEGVLGLNHGGTSDLRIIIELGLQMILLVLFGGLCGSLNNVFVHMSSQNIGNDIRKDCFQRIMNFSFPQIDQFGIATLVTRLTNDITQVQTYISLFVRGMIRTSMLMFGSMYFMFRLNHDFGRIVLCAFPLIVGCLVFCMVKADPLFTKLQAQLDRINGILQEDITGIRMIKACVREVYEKIRFGKTNDELVKNQLHILVIFAFMNPLINALMYIVVAIILYMGFFEVENSVTTPGNIMAAITYTTQLLNGILMLVMLFQNISRGIASWKRIRELLHCEPQLKDGTFEGETEVQGEIVFSDVSFSYSSNGREVLDHINLTIHQGETLAIMGSTGCGKSSLIHLIPRFYDCNSGTVYVDGIDVREYKQKKLREKIAIVLQKSELFSTTIQENLSWGAPQVSLEEIREAAKAAQADEFISSSLQGYETRVAERGASLSGGQKQRLSIARAVLKKAEILIFDDATSALDLKTEAALYQAIQKISPKSTKIIVAQRIASIRHADRIVVLENGTITACGTHEELLKNCKTYQDIYHSQIGEEDAVYAYAG